MAVLVENSKLSVIIRAKIHHYRLFLFSHDRKMLLCDLVIRYFTSSLYWQVTLLKQTIKYGPITFADPCSIPTKNNVCWHSTKTAQDYSEEQETGDRAQLWLSYCTLGAPAKWQFMEICWNNFYPKQCSYGSGNIDIDNQSQCLHCNIAPKLWSMLITWRVSGFGADQCQWRG